MIKAEERALESYPEVVRSNYADNINGYEHYLEDDVNNALCRKVFTEGYEQAEKDLALTVEDIKAINKLLVEIRYEIKNFGSYNDIPWYRGDGMSEYEEVLRRFLEIKKDV
jgi:hypothetical protein